MRPAAQIFVGDVVAERFEVLAIAAAGGMGTVCRALDRETDDVVALKLVHRPDSRSVLRRWEREAGVLATLSHPGVVRYVGHGFVEGIAWLAMEWLEGEDLAAVLERRRLELHEAIEVVRGAAEALAAAHDAGIVHRDVKPSNLFLVDGDPGRVKVVDFGIARLPLLNLTALTQTGMPLGTPRYMAPEQARGEKNIDARADLFALGCVLFEALTGGPAFPGGTPIACLAKILFQPSPRLEQHLDDAPETLAELIERWLAKDPADRPADAGAAARELGDLADLRPAAKGLPRSASPKALTKTQRRLLVVILARASAVETPSLEVLRALVEPYDGVLEPLADGSSAVVFNRRGDRRGGGEASDQAVRAARCAMELRDCLPQAAFALAMGLGEFTGTAPVGHVIDRATVVLEALLEDDGRIGLDNVAAGLLETRFTIRRESDGFFLGTEISDETSAKKLLGRSTPFVGRRRELATLIAAYDECAEEEIARAVIVTAPAGMGKSRLRREFLTALRDRDDAMEIWQASADMFGAGAPLGLLAGLLRAAFGLQDGESAVRRVERLRERVARRVEEAEQNRVSEFLAEILGLGDVSPVSPRLEQARRNAADMGEQAAAAFEDFLVAETSHRPIVLVLEDLHWGDLSTVRFLDGALRRLEEQPLLVVAFARPEVSTIFPGLWEERGADVLRLSQLSRKAGRRLVRHLLGDDLDDAVVDRLVELATGNAFYLEELIRTAAEGVAAEGEIPATVLAMLQARIEGLDPVLRHALRAAGVFGETFWIGGAEALLGEETRDASSDPWNELAASEWIEKRPKSRFPNDEEYVFRHALVREAVYETLTDADRRLGHRLAGDWLESVGEVAPVMLGEHFERSDAPKRAVPYFEQAARLSMSASDPVMASAYYERGIQCGAEGEQLGGLLAYQGDTYLWSGHMEKAKAAFAQSLQHLPHGTSAWFHAMGQNAWLSGSLGDAESMMREAEEALAAEIAPDAFEGFITGGGWICRGAVLCSKFQEAQIYVRRIARKVGPRVFQPRERLWSCVGEIYLALYLHADLWKARELGREAMEIAEEIGDRWSKAWLTIDASLALHELGEYAEICATRPGEIERLERNRSDFYAAWGRLHLACAWIVEGKLDEAQESVERAEAFWRRFIPTVVPYCISRRAWLAWLRGDLERAEELARAAVEGRGYRHQENQLLLARILLARGSAAAAQKLAVRIHRRVTPHGFASYLTPATGLTLGDAHRAVGDEEAAASAYAEAAGHLHRLARRVPDEAARRRYLTEVEDNAELLRRAPSR